MTFWLFGVAGVFAVYALVSRRLSTTAITGLWVPETVSCLTVPRMHLWP